MNIGNVDAKLLSKRPSLGEAMLECVPIRVEDYNSNLPPPSYGTAVPYSRGRGSGRNSPALLYGQIPPSRGGRSQDDSGHYGTMPPTRGGRFPEEMSHYGNIPPSRGGRISPSNYAAPPPRSSGRFSPSQGSSARMFARARTIDINTATLQLLSTATQTDPHLFPNRLRFDCD